MLTIRPFPSRRPLLVAGSLVAALALSACGSVDPTVAANPETSGSSSATQTPAADVELVLYSGRGQDLIEPLVDRFNDADLGAHVTVRYGDSVDLALLLEAEGSATDADVFISQAPGAVSFLADAELLAPLDTEILDAVDEQFRSTSGSWVGLSGRQRVIVHNTDLIDAADLPTSVFDLVEPEWKGRFAVAPTNGSFQDFVSAMRLVVGDEQTTQWLEGIVANDVQTYPKNSAIVDAVARGEVELGLVNHYYNFRALAEDPSLPSRNANLEDGDVGNLVIMSTASIMVSTDQAAAAKVFIEFLLNEDSQTYFRDETFEYPVAAGIDANPDLVPLADQVLPDVDIEDLGTQLRATVDLISDAGLRS